MASHRICHRQLCHRADALQRQRGIIRIQTRAAAAPGNSPVCIRAYNRHLRRAGVDGQDLPLVLQEGETLHARGADESAGGGAVVFALGGLGGEIAAFGALNEGEDVFGGEVDSAGGEGAGGEGGEDFVEAPFGREGEFDVAAGEEGGGRGVCAAPVGDDGARGSGSATVRLFI